MIRRDLQDQFLEITRSVQKTAIFITHDLEEAMKLGNRVAIMRDARIVQIGKPEEILSAPADTYVRDFVRGISRQLVLKAADIMRQVVEQRDRDLAASASARARPDERLDSLIERIADKPGPITVYDGDDLVGVIDVSDFLSAIKPG